MLTKHEEVPMYTNLNFLPSKWKYLLITPPLSNRKLFFCVSVTFSFPLELATYVMKSKTIRKPKDMSFFFLNVLPTIR